MIRVSHLNKQEFFVNCELIEQIEETPDTVLTMLSGRKIIVAESAREVIALTMEFKRKAHGIVVKESNK
jgi:flagellar protein FlbD